MITKPLSTREKIIKTATRLFWEKSFSCVSVDIICKEAGIQKGSFYHFFPSKDNLATTILDELWQQHKDHFITPTFDPAVSPMERFNRLLHLLGDTATKIKEDCGYFLGCPFGNLATELSTQNEAIRTKLDEIFSEYIQCFKANLDDAVAQGELPATADTQQLALLLTSCIQGSVLLAKTKNDPNLLKSAFHTLLDTIRQTAAQSLEVAA